jgi:hypothetical protein
MAVQLKPGDGVLVFIFYNEEPIESSPQDLGQYSNRTTFFMMGEVSSFKDPIPGMIIEAPAHGAWVKVLCNNVLVYCSSKDVTKIV